MATYSEKRFEGVRLFEPFPDKLVVKGRQSFRSDYEASIPLRTLNPDFARLRIRHRAFWMGLLIWVVVASLHGIPAIRIFELPHAVGGLAIGALLMVVALRKIEYVQFRSDAGLVVLDIARKGKDKERFEEFISLLVERIKQARSEG